MRRLTYKLLLLASLFIVLDQLYCIDAFYRFVEQEAEQYLQVKKIENCDVIYVSASSNFPPEHKEADPRKISQFIADYFPELRFEAINKPAAHAGNFYPLLRLFSEDADANTFIVTLNLRSFGPTWIHSELSTALNKAQVFYNDRPPLLNRFLVSLNAYDDLSNEERFEQVKTAWDHDQLPFNEPRNTVTNWCAVEKWGDWRNPKRQLADQFIKQFGFVIDENNPRVKDFDAICNLAEERGWDLKLNLLPENIETADSLVGEELTMLMRSNADFLLDRYNDRGITVIDNLDVLSAERFTDKDFPTEHYDEVGRKIIALNLAEALKDY